MDDQVALAPWHSPLSIDFIISPPGSVDRVHAQSRSACYQPSIVLDVVGSTQKSQK